MPVPLRVLILEDRPADAELIIYELKRAGYAPDWQRVDTRLAYQESLRPDLDLIIADYSLPQFDALNALSLLKQQAYDIPFVVVSGSISEEVAVEMMKQGAADYLLKDRLARLGQAVANALHQKRERDERREAQAALRENEVRFRRLADNAPDPIYHYFYLPTPHFEYVSPALEEMTGYSPQECYANPNLFYELVLPEDRVLDAEAARADQEDRPFVRRWLCKDGRVIWVERRNVQVYNEAGQVIAVEGIAREVTDRIQHQRELETIASVSTALRTAPDRASLIATILDQVDQLLQADGSAMSLKEQNSDDLVTVLANGKLAHINGMYTPAGLGLSGHAMQTGLLYVTQDFASDPYSYRKELFGEIQAMACAPLITQDQNIGVLIIARQTMIDDHEARLLTLIANIAANAIQRTSLHEATRRNAHQMAAVSEIGRVLSENLDKNVIFKHLDHYLYELIPGISSIFISSFDEKSQQFICQSASVYRQLEDMGAFPPAHLEPPGHGLQSEVFYSRQTLIINDLAARIVHLRGNVTLIGEDGGLPQSGLYAPMLVRDRVIGVIILQSDRPNHFNQEDADALSLVANTAAAAIENAYLLEDLQRSNLELIKAYDTTLEGWARALDLRDHETENHTQRVAEVTVRLGRSMGISGDELINLQRGALLHDFGKVGIPDGILLKAGPLTPAEMEIMRRHPQYAYDLMRPIEYLRGALDVPYCHHEKWDGSGYPHGLQGEAIPLVARIFAVVDVWDALCSDRPYRRAWSEVDALTYIRDQSGHHFDPAIVAAFFKMIGKE
jgi:PAS domain S-box-containing protein